MSDIVRTLDRGYSLIWREDRLEDALRGLDDDFESGVPAEMRFGQMWTFRGGRAMRMEMYTDVDEARRAAGLDPR